jgi:hypothetical protein
MPAIVNDSTTSRPLGSRQTSRVKPGPRLAGAGTVPGPWTWVHCLTSSIAFAGATVVSAVPCQIDTRGHGPRWGDAARTRSPHSGAARLRPWNMLSKASRTFVAVP